MNLIKSFDYFDPAKLSGGCHIIGCGSVGSTVAENLARLGITNFCLYDFDVVESKNIVNQMFSHADIGRPKTEAVRDMIISINPEAEKHIEIFNDGYKSQHLAGYVFLAVDNIELRRDICLKNKFNKAIKAVFDFRTRLEDGQTYAADWGDLHQINNLLSSMEFSHEEAHEATPVSACGIVLGIAPTVRFICTLGVGNFINFVKRGEIKQTIIANPFAFEVDAL